MRSRSRDGWVCVSLPGSCLCAGNLAATNLSSGQIRRLLSWTEKNLHPRASDGQKYFLYRSFTSSFPRHVLDRQQDHLHAPAFIIKMPGIEQQFARADAPE